MSNQVQEICGLLVKWAKKWTGWWWVSHIINILAMMAIVALTSYYCNYIYGVAEDKSVILYWLILPLVISVIYLFCLWREDKESFKWLAVIIMLTIAVLGAWDAYHCKCLVGDMKPITLHYLVGFFVTITTIYIFVWRAINQEKQTKIQTEQIKKQEEQIKIQVDKGIDERFTAAVSLLGSSETSARTGAIYSLYQQAVDEEKYRKQIVQILCSHIRSKTQEPDYKKDHKTRPSNEIQTTIDLLFRAMKKSIGLYHQFRQELPNANLSYAYCVGANFSGARCEGAYFWGTRFQGANFVGAYCQEAGFYKAHFEGAYFMGACCQGATFFVAHCQGTNFGGAYCEGATFLETHCEGACFMETYCQGATFEGVHCEGAYSSISTRFLEKRIYEQTELEKLILKGPLSKLSTDAIEKAKPYCSSIWYLEMQKIIKDSEKEKEESGPPSDGVNIGVLENSEELQKIIEFLKDIRES